MSDAIVALEQPTLPLWHVLGAGAAATLQAVGLPLPAQDMEVRFQEPASVMRASAREYLVITPQAPISPADQSCWVLRRNDHLLALRGLGWRAVMPWVCHFDFNALEAGHWLQVAMAGVDVWALQTDGDSLLIGCDPSYGAYLQTLLHQIIREHAVSTSTV